MEHPQVPTWMYHTPAPSIWRLPVVRALAEADAVAGISFDQCIFGACGIKPTTFLVARMPHFRILVRQTGLSGRCHHGPGAYVGLAGKKDCRFRTAGAKIYPEA